MFLTASGRSNHQVQEQFTDWKYSLYLPLEEKQGIARVNEPAEYYLKIDDGQCLNATKEVRVATVDGVEVPSQVYNVSTYASGYVEAVNVVWLANASALSPAEYYIYWGNPSAPAPTYATDIAAEATSSNITVWNTYYKATFTYIQIGISDTMQYLYYKPYSTTLSLGRSDWHQLFQTVINIDPYWFLPFNGVPIAGTNVTVEGSGPIFIDVKAVYGDWKIASVNSLVKTYRFYAHLPWFTISSNFNLTGANYQHIQTEAYISREAFPFATYPTKAGAPKTMGIAPSQGDLLDWNGTWVDAETTNTTDNPIGMAFISMPGTTPPYTGFRSDQSGIAPFQNGTLLAAHQNLAILLHQGNYLVAEQLYNQTQHLLLPPPGLGPVKSMSVLAAIIDKVSGVASPGIKVDMFFRDNGTLYAEVETNDKGTAVFKDVPAGNYTVTAMGVSQNVTVTNQKPYWPVRIRVMVPRPFLIYVVVGVGVCIGLIAVISVIRRRK